MHRLSSARPRDAVSAAANDNAISDVRQLSPEPAARSSIPAQSAQSAAPEDPTRLEHRLSALAESELVPDSDAATLADASESVLSPKPAPEPNVATRALTHVPQDAWLDARLELPQPEADTRQRLAWRFKAAFTAWKLLLPTCSKQPLRGQMLEQMRRYEHLLRNAGPRPAAAARQQLSDALHLSLSEAKTVELERELSQLEGVILSVDASISQEAFKARWNREHVDPRQLLRYARLLASRRFGIGYRRDRFEALALELLTARLPSGRLLLMPRRRALQVMRQLLRGLHRPSATTEDHAQAIGYLRDALDRLDAMAGPKPFFDSDFYLDVYGYKISRHDRILSPEFLYLSVAIEVDIHNHMLTWSQTATSETGRPLSLAALQLSLRAQKEAAQAVFADFHRPLAGSAVAAKPATRKVKAKPAAAKRATSSGARLLAASVFALAALTANLYVTGTLRVTDPPRALNAGLLQAVSPLLVSARLSSDGKRLRGRVSRPSWRRLSPRKRIEEAERIASELKQRGIEHAELLAYKNRAIQIDFGSVVYVDDAP